MQLLVVYQLRARLTIQNSTEKLNIPTCQFFKQLDQCYRAASSMCPRRTRSRVSIDWICRIHDFTTKVRGKTEWGPQVYLAPTEER